MNLPEFAGKTIQSASEQNAVLVIRFTDGTLYCVWVDGDYDCQTMIVEEAS